MKVHPDDDPLLQWQSSITQALAESQTNPSAEAHLDSLLEQCVAQFKDDQRYHDDVRFLKIWILYADSIQDFEGVFKMMEERRTYLSHSLLYMAYALYMEAKLKWVEADQVYKLGISRKAEPIKELKESYSEFIKRISNYVDRDQPKKIDNTDCVELDKSCIDPWSISTIDDLLKKMNSRMSKYTGYQLSSKAYSGKVPLPSLHNKSAKKKVIDLGGKKYQIQGCLGQGGFAKVFKAYENSNPDDVVALKIQKPPFPWEFYMYRQLDTRISDEKRSSFAFSHRVHIYSDCSILVCDYLDHGTLLDAINSYGVLGQTMEEVLCIYYTIEMLYMLETLHSVAIIHGDFKPDNLLIRYARGDLKEDGFSDRTGPWRDQGLCLIDWGRGIDLNLFPDGTKFTGDCRTDRFRCVEMQRRRPWKFQVDTYGLCVIIHLMLYGDHMEVVKKVSPEGKEHYQPKTSLKRYWNVDLWSNLFKSLLNVNPEDDHLNLLQSLRKSFEDYMSSTPQLINKLTQLLRKQRASLCSS